MIVSSDDELVPRRFRVAPEHPELYPSVERSAITRGPAPHPGPPSEMGCDGVIPRPASHGPTPEPPGRQGLTSIDPVGSPLPSRRTRVARRVPDRGDYDLTPCHWRAINRGKKRSLPVTRGQFAPQVRRHGGPDATDSQADSGGSIPLTRSKQEPQVMGGCPGLRRT
jgi:hypothetical protein